MLGGVYSAYFNNGKGGNGNGPNVQQMIQYDSEIGSKNSAPKLTKLHDYPEWQGRFLAHLNLNDPSLVIPLIEGYERPYQEGFIGVRGREVPVSRLQGEVRTAYDREAKAYATLTTALTTDILHQFEQYRTTKQLWDALAERFQANEQLKNSKKQLLRKEFDMFMHFKNETLDQIISRFCHLLATMDDYEIFPE